MSEADFWSWVAQEKAKLDEVLGQVDEPPTLLEWIEQQVKVAGEAKFSAALRRDQDGVSYWRGYASALRDVLTAIQRREVRA